MKIYIRRSIKAFTMPSAILHNLRVNGVSKSCATTSACQGTCVHYSQETELNITALTLSRFGIKFRDICMRNT